MSDNCPDCNAVPGAFHTPMCGARDSGAQIWVGTHHVPALQAQLTVLRDELNQALARIGDLEAQRLQYEADLAAADLAETGYHDDWPNPVGADQHGETCQCPYCPGEPTTMPKPNECPCGYEYSPAGDCPGALHGCTWHNEDPEDDGEYGQYDPGPECDDQGGMSEIHVTIADGEESS